MPAAPDWWRTWFGPAYLALYDAYLLERTPLEVDQLERLLGLRPPAGILDLACGQGRHAIELARRGYQLTGVDLSTHLLEVARGRAKEAGLRIRWLEADMRRPPVGPEFDLVLNLFTALGYFADEADNQAVLRAARQTLRPGGRMLLEVLNGERQIRQFQEREWFTVGARTVIENRRMDTVLRRMEVTRTVENGGISETATHSLRLYTAEDLTAMFTGAGFCGVTLFGDWDGSPFQADSLRLLVLATRGD